MDQTSRNHCYFDDNCFFAVVAAVVVGYFAFRTDDIQDFMGKLVDY